ncbi:MAG TPA: penicillin-binding protein 1C [Bacteroidota bacterium]|nr:penicillin-binding protein 1C [Bacteroidota bacterium]
MKRVTLFRLIVATSAGLSLFVASWFHPLPEEDFRKESVHSLRVVERNGIVLREFLNDQEGRGEWKSLAEIPHVLQEATIAVEDRRFAMHPGVDIVAVGRAVFENIKAGRFVSGGSSITQQVIRNVYRHPRSPGHKILEAWYALRLERMFSKNEILEQYLNRAPYGNQLFGIEAASRQYFGKPARDLTLAEAAFLSGLPNAPSLLNPYKNLPAAVDRQRLILKRMLDQGKIQEEEYHRALIQPLRIQPAEASFRAPHVAEMAARHVAEIPGAFIVKTTIDYALQSNIEWLIKGHLRSLEKKNVTNASVIVIDNASGEVRVLVGSADYFDDVHEGQVNGALSYRQPGSAIKPFTYGIALESGFTPATLLADIPTFIPDDKGDYIPENYDRQFHGPVMLRTALACSYNIPAVRTLQAVGRDQLLQRLQRTGFDFLTQPADYYGWGLTLGNGEVTLLELTNAYAALARGGEYRPARWISAVRGAENMQVEPNNLEVREVRQLFESRVAYLLTDILSDPVARRPAFGNAFHFPFRCAVKTGTTKDYRDNWTVGYTTTYTVGVWVGNFDGSPMRGVSGITGAGQIFSDIMMLLHIPPTGSIPGDWSPPRGLSRVSVCARSGQLPGRHCDKTLQSWFLKETLPALTCDMHQRFRIRTEEGEVTRVYEMLGPEYRTWVEELHFSIPPPDAVRVGEERIHTRQDRDPLAITSPNDGDIFKLDPVLRTEFQSIRVVGSVDETVHSPALVVDGSEEVPFAGGQVWWQLKKGLHRLSLEGTRRGERVVSRPIVLTVE